MINTVERSKDSSNNGFKLESLTGGDKKSALWLKDSIAQIQRGRGSVFTAVSMQNADFILVLLLLYDFSYEQL